MSKKGKVSIGQVFKTIIWPRRGMVLIGLVLIVISRGASLVIPWQSQELLDDVKKSFDSVGEKTWQLPICSEYEEDVTKNTIADMVNSSSGGQAGSQNGGCFVKQFVGDTPWLHFDIAGVCWPERQNDGLALGFESARVLRRLQCGESEMGSCRPFGRSGAWRRSNRGIPGRYRPIASSRRCPSDRVG